MLLKIFNNDLPILVNFDDRFTEERWIGIGVLNTFVSVVVFSEPDVETIRIISARLANKYEQEKYSAPLESDWEKLKSLKESDIDYSDIPPLNERFFERSSVYVPASKRASVVEVDDDIIEWFRNRNDEYQSLINLILRKYIERQEDSKGIT